PATGFRMLPLRLYLFSDGWFITDASPAYRDLIGQRLVRIGTKDIDEAFSIIRPFVGADNEATVRDRVPLYLLCPEVLQALGVVPNANAVPLTITDERGDRRQADVHPTALITYFYWYFEPLRPWKRQLPESGLPLYRQAAWGNYWFRYLEGQHTMYV